MVYWNLKLDNHFTCHFVRLAANTSFGAYFANIGQSFDQLKIKYLWVFIFRLMKNQSEKLSEHLADTIYIQQGAMWLIRKFAEYGI